MGRPSLFSSLLHFALSLAPLFLLSSGEPTPFKDVSMENPVIQFVPPPPSAGHSCERVSVSGASRLNLKHYASALHLRLNASSETILNKLHGKIEVCSHRNVSMGMCQCGNDLWKAAENGHWGAAISPYGKRYIDVKVTTKLSGPITVTVEEDFQQWRLIFLGFGLLLLLLAPIFSTWVPFYVCSSMAVGVLAVVLLLVFQLMKLVPMGRKNVLYLTLYSSVLGVGSYIAHYFSTLVNSILVNFGLNEEMHYPVSTMLLVLIVLAGAGLGYWIVRKYVISPDGSIDAGIAQFVKWAMRVLAVVSILQSSHDSLLPVVALGVCLCICFLSNKWRIRADTQLEDSENASVWQPRREQASSLWTPRKQSTASSRRTEFLSRSPNSGTGGAWRSSASPYGQPNRQITAAPHTYSSPRQRSPIQREDYYSTFNMKTPARRFTKAQWEDFTRESTREALADWAASPEVTKWIADNAHRMKISHDSASDNSTESSSDSSDATVVENGSRLNIFNLF